MHLARPEVAFWPRHCSMQDDEDWNENIKNLKNRAGREFYYAEEKISDEHREYLKWLIHTYPFSNHIFDGEPKLNRIFGWFDLATTLYSFVSYQVILNLWERWLLCSRHDSRSCVQKMEHVYPPKICRSFAYFISTLMRDFASCWARFLKLLVLGGQDKYACSCSEIFAKIRLFQGRNRWTADFVTHLWLRLIWGDDIVSWGEYRRVARTVQEPCFRGNRHYSITTFIFILSRTKQQTTIDERNGWISLVEWWVIKKMMKPLYSSRRNMGSSKPSYSCGTAESFIITLILRPCASRMLREGSIPGYEAKAIWRRSWICFHFILVVNFAVAEQVSDTQCT